MAKIKAEDTAYSIPETPQYDPIIRKLKVSDPAHAEAVCTKVVLTANKWTGSAMPFTQAVAMNGIIKTNTEESLLYIAPNISSSETIANCEVIGSEIQSNKVVFKATKKPSCDVSFLVVNAGTVSI